MERRIIQGLMRVRDLSDDELYNLIKFDLEQGLNYFDLADIYVNGEAESKLGRIMDEHKELRDQITIQTKCSIKRSPGGNYYDLSCKHILEAVDDSLSRLKTDTIDVLLLHRPDIFIDAEEVNNAFCKLKKEGKVKSFGVSNFSKETIEYLKQGVSEPLKINQVQLGLGHMNIIEEVFNFNMDVNHQNGELFFYAKKNNMILQAWSPYQKGFFGGSIFNEDNELNHALSELGEKYGVSKCAIATSFILKLGENMRVVTGSVSKDHVKEALDGEKVNMTKEEWYMLYKKANGMLP